MGLDAKDLISDAALRSADEDRLDHDAVAAVVADLAVSVRTSANVALFGPWGSGKSSLFALIAAHLKKRTGQPHVAMIRYDAWKFAGPGLHRNFLNEVVRQLGLSDRDKAHIDGGVERSRLRLGTYLRRNWKSLIGALLLGLAIGAAWILLRGWAESSWAEDPKHPVPFINSVVKALPSGGAAFGLVVGALVLGNQSMSSLVEKRTQSPLQDADQFFASFDQMMKRLTRKRWVRRGKQVDRLVVFVDELDRCSPEKVVDSLVQLMTYLGHDQCVFVVAADREVIEEALEEAPQAKPIRENEPYYSTSGAFLDKVFQHQIELPPTRPEALTAYAMSLANDAGGVWEELRGQDPRTYEDVVYALVPSHVRSPRRVKVLMNDFATAVRVLERRGIAWRDHVVQIAILTVLQTEFPSVARAFLVHPRLLDVLLGKVEQPSEDVAAVAAKFDPSSVTPAAPMLSDPDAAVDTTRERAAKRLNEQLLGYLRRLSAAEVAMPTPDLIYVQNAAHADGLEDPALARVLDTAADTDPDAVVAAFAEASDSDRRAAVRFLIAQLGNTFGALRANLVEEAARIAATLTSESAKEIAPFAAPQILSETVTGRWRPEMTLGAVWLGLLDPKAPNPFGAIGPTGAVEALGSSGELAILVERMPHMGPRTRLLFPIIRESYSDHPDVLLKVLSDLRADLVAQFWAAGGDVVKEWLLLQAAAAISAGTTPASQPTAAEIAEAGRERYADALDAVTGRGGDDLSDVVRSLLESGATSSLPLRPEITARLAVLRTAMREADRNRAALALIGSADTADDAVLWIDWLDPMSSGPYPAAVTACEALARFVVADPLGSAAQSSMDAVGRAAGWLNEDDADAVATIAHEALIGSPPDGTKPNRVLRDSMRSLLSILEEVHPAPGYVGGYFLASHLAAIEDGQVSVAGCGQFLAEVKRLGADQAAHVDDRIESVQKTTAAATNDAVSCVRLRIAARQISGRAPLPPADVLPVLPDPETVVTREWLQSNPPLKDFLTFISKFTPNARNMSIYAQKRNVSERSRIWIAIEKRGWDDEHLAAVGKHGVNATVVAHMAPKIQGVSLVDQGPATRRLVTCDLGFNKEVKSATNDLAMKVLASRTAGAGPNAARLAIASSGAASGRTDELRRAFDAYSDAVPRHQISAADLRALDGLRLFTHRKKSPFATALNWFPKVVAGTSKDGS